MRARSESKMAIKLILPSDNHSFYYIYNVFFKPNFEFLNRYTIHFSPIMLHN